VGNNIKGITIEIGGNTGPLTTALKGVNKTAGDLQGELREVNKQLKFDPKNTELLKQKEDLLKQSTQALEEKQKTLKTAVEQAHTAFEKGDMGADKVRAVEREYEKVNSQLKDSKKQLNAVESQVGTFSEKVKAKFAGVKESVKSAFSSENIKTALGGIGVAAGAFLGSSLNEAKDAEKINTDLEQTLKSTKGAAGMTAESLEDLSRSMVENTAYSEDEVKSGESMLLTFTQIGKDVFPQATAATLDYAQKMGVDAKSAALTLGKALNDPATGLSKLTKSGVTFTDAQKKQITAMQKAGDIAGAQKLMIAELNKEFGGQAAAAADTYAGKQKQLENTLKEVKETIGGALMPVLASIMKTIAPIIQKIAEFVTQHPKLTAAILAIVAVIGTLVGGLSLVTTVMSAFAAAQTVALGPLALVVAAIAGLAALAVVVVTHWKPISAFFKNLWSGILEFFKKLPGEFSSVAKSIGDKIVHGFDSAVSFIKSLPTKALQWGKDFIAGLANGIKGAIGTVEDAVSTVAQKIRSFLHFSKPDEGPLADADQYGKDFMALLAQTIKDHSGEPAEAAKLAAKQVSDRLASVKANLASTTAQLTAQLNSLSSAETKALSGTTGKQRSAIEAEYAKKKKIIQSEIALRKQQADAEIAQINKVKQAVESALTAEGEKNKSFVEGVNSLEKEVEDALKNKYTAEEQDAENALNKELDALETWKTAQEDAINSVYTARENAIQAQIDALDKETAAEDRTATRKGYTDKITDLQGQITYSHDDYNKSQLQKQLAAEQADYQTELDKEARDDRKAALQSQLDAVKNEQSSELQSVDDTYDAKKKALDDQLQTTKDTYAKMETDAALEAKAEQLIMAQNQTAIVNLLKSYSSDYNAAGSDLGDALLTGFKPKVDAISALVQGVAQQIEAARQTADSAMAAAASAAAASASVTASKTAASSSGTSGGKSVSVTNNVTVAQKTTAAQALAVVKAVTAQVLFGV
jgi:hypothetical protein